MTLCKVTKLSFAFIANRSILLVLTSSSEFLLMSQRKTAPSKPDVARHCSRREYSMFFTQFRWPRSDRILCFRYLKWFDCFGEDIIFESHSVFFSGRRCGRSTFHLSGGD